MSELDEDALIRALEEAKGELDGFAQAMSSLEGQEATQDLIVSVSQHINRAIGALNKMQNVLLSCYEYL